MMWKIAHHEHTIYPSIYFICTTGCFAWLWRFLGLFQNQEILHMFIPRPHPCVRILCWFLASCQKPWSGSV